MLHRPISRLWLVLEAYNLVAIELRRSEVDEIVLVFGSEMYLFHLLKLVNRDSEIRVALTNQFLFLIGLFASCIGHTDIITLH